MAERLLVVRTPSGISGDMLCAGLAVLAGFDDSALADAIATLGVPALGGSARVVDHSVLRINGFRLDVRLPHVHAHRSFKDICAIIEASEMSPHAQTLARSAFDLLAEVEGRIHGIPASEVAFHEIGALDSILDICLAAVLYDKLQPERLICSPLPVADGAIRCAHGLLMSPAPAVQDLLAGVPIYGVPAEGETVTPTALALLKAFGAKFGNWPNIVPEKLVRIYGGKVFKSLPNGALFAIGNSHAFGATDAVSISAHYHLDHLHDHG
jgi:uncharacterized protein (DUF111 family)